MSAPLPFVPASPRSRGWTVGHLGAVPLADGFPALAGMDLCSPDLSAILLRLPRARGDGPTSSSSTPSVTAASPRSRGWTHPVGRLERRHHGFPALAGMDP